MANKTKIFFSLSLILSLSILVLTPLIGLAAGSSTVDSYTWEVGIPGFANPGSVSTFQAGSLTNFVKNIIKWAFRLAGILAFAMIIYAGFEYAIFSGAADKQKDALNKITDAIVGLLLLFSFWIILNTINPDILQTKEHLPPAANPTNYSLTSHDLTNFIAVAKSMASRERITSYNEAKNNPQLQLYLSNLQKYLGIDPETDPTHGESCDMYVATVVRATLDPNYPATWVPTQYNYLNKSPQFYCFVFTDLSQTQKGDILFTTNKDHTALKLNNGFYQASNGQYYPSGPTSSWYNSGYACRNLNFAGGGGGSQAG